MQTTYDIPELGLADPSSVAGIPRGPRGLWSALASVSATSVCERALPTSDMSLLGSRPGGAMFDYDPDLAVSLGDELDVALFLS